MVALVQQKAQLIAMDWLVQGLYPAAILRQLEGCTAM
jgi:hypothetical protein